MRENQPFLFAPDEVQQTVNNSSIRNTIARLSPVLLVALPGCNPLPFLENGGAAGILVAIWGVSTYFMHRSHEQKEIEDIKRNIADEIKRRKEVK